MRWLRLVGSLELQVSFAKESYKRDYILKKRPIVLRSLSIVATQYNDPLPPHDLNYPPRIYIYIYTYMYIYVYIYMYVYLCIFIRTHIQINHYGVATISRLLKIIGLFCERAL